MSFGKEIMSGLLITLFSVIVFVYYLISYNKFTLTQVSTSTNSDTSVSGKVVNGVLNLSLAELQKHNTPSDCWIVIYNKVLKITPYLNLHPGGISTITSFCGADGTKAFDSKGRNGHSSYAVNLLERFTIGILGQTINPSVLTQPVDTSNININRGQERDD